MCVPSLRSPNFPPWLHKRAPNRTGVRLWISHCGCLENHKVDGNVNKKKNEKDDWYENQHHRIRIGPIPKTSSEISSAARNGPIVLSTGGRISSNIHFVPLPPIQSFIRLCRSHQPQPSPSQNLSSGPMSGRDRFLEGGPPKAIFENSTLPTTTKMLPQRSTTHYEPFCCVIEPKSAHSWTYAPSIRKISEITNISDLRKHTRSIIYNEHTTITYQIYSIYRTCLVYRIKNAPIYVSIPNIK